MFLFICLFLICLFIICLFTFPKLSPIPYFPTNKKDVSLIVKLFRLTNNQIVFDLGAGDGAVIFAAAKEAFKKNLNTTFIAVEINPVLVLILHIKKLFNPNKKNIKIILGDLFKMNLRHPERSEGSIANARFSKTNSEILRFAQNDKASFYLYVSPWLLEKITKKIINEIPKARIISYMYPVKSLKRKEKIIRGENIIFFYS